MSRLHARFELFVHDHAASIAFYERALGFEVARRHDNYVSLRHGDVTIGLGRIDDLPEHDDGPGFTRSRLRDDRGAGVEIVFETDRLDALHDRARASGYPLAAPLTDRPWGLRDFRIADPDGYYLRVTEFATDDE
ncbi:MAG TPA: VOC family protein [Jatrophihabitans sp.]|nr:VOC family protein [Jatrophihabitans sp.]